MAPRRPQVIVEVAARAGCETYACFMMQKGTIGRRVYDLLTALGNEGHFDISKTYIVFGSEGDSTNVMIVWPPEEDWERLLPLVITECALRLSLFVGRLDSPGDYNSMKRYAQAARAQDN